MPSSITRTDSSRRDGGGGGGGGGEPATGGKGTLVGLAEGILQAARRAEAGDDQSSVKLAVMAKQLTAATTGPKELIGGYAVAMGEIGALYQFMVWKLFDRIPADGSISYKALADSINGDENLVARLGGMLVSTGRLAHPRAGHVAHSSTSHVFKSTSKPGALFRVLFEHGLRGYTHWMEYFEAYGNKEPASVRHNPFTFSWGHPEDTVWEVVDTDAERAAVFSSAMQSMGSIASGFGGPASVYDFRWLGAEREDGRGSGAGRPLIVDVGGSHGETLKSILDAVPEISQRRCVVQDRPEVIREVLARGSLVDVKLVAHDFFQPNPSPGAMIYLLRRVLHDWSDESCIKILSRLAEALPADNPRARVLIMEQVVSEPPSPRSAAADMIMLNIGGKERTPSGFRKIVEGAGMRIVNIHLKEGSEVGVVECARL